MKILFSLIQLFGHPTFEQRHRRDKTKLSLFTAVGATAEGMDEFLEHTAAGRPVIEVHDFILPDGSFKMDPVDYVRNRRVDPTVLAWLEKGAEDAMRAYNKLVHVRKGASQLRLSEAEQAAEDGRKYRAHKLATRLKNAVEFAHRKAAQPSIVPSPR